MNVPPESTFQYAAEAAWTATRHPGVRVELVPYQDTGNQLCIPLVVGDGSGQRPAHLYLSPAEATQLIADLEYAMIPGRDHHRTTFRATQAPVLPERG